MAVETTRWGVLYCPKSRIYNVEKHRQRIKDALTQQGVAFDFVQSENADSVERLVQMLIANGYKTLLIVGGDSALNDAVNCLMALEKDVRDEIALGVLPNGVMNDFARFWGFDADDIEGNIQKLAARRLKAIDLGCVRYVNRHGERCHRYFLNCLNIGLTADIMNLRRQTRRLFGSRTLSFLSSFVVMLFHRMDYKMCLRINDDTIDRQVMTVCVGSGPGYGQTPNAVPYNGWLDVSVVYQPQVMQLLAGLWLLVSGRFLNHKNVHPYRTRHVEVEQAKHALVGIDGRLLNTPVGSYRVDIEPEVVKFVIPE